MLFKVVTVAILAAVLAPASAFSQSIAQIGGPAEQPPAGYNGLQYVDSRGCVFMRVESSGNAKWYPRVNAAHKPVCNQPGSGGAVEVAQDEPAPQVAIEPLVTAQAEPAYIEPMATVASELMPEVAPRAVQLRPRAVVPVQPDTRYEQLAATSPSRGQIGCYASAPVAEVVQLRNGGTAVMCTRGDGTTGGWRPPVYADGSRPGIALTEPVQVAQSTHNSSSDNGDLEQVYASADARVQVPNGYKAAWKDDRLNPRRGLGTVQGQAAQDQVWTRKVPAKLVADVAKKAARKKAKSGSVTISTMNSATSEIKSDGSRYVQIGTFGVASNAAGAVSRLQSMGLPVAKSKLTKGGKVLQVVMAGPFGSANDAHAALQMARQAGFGDAYLR